MPRIHDQFQQVRANYTDTPRDYDIGAIVGPRWPNYGGQALKLARVPRGMLPLPILARPYCVDLLAGALGGTRLMGFAIYTCPNALSVLRHSEGGRKKRTIDRRCRPKKKIAVYYVGQKTMGT